MLLPSFIPPSSHFPLLSITPTPPLFSPSLPLPLLPTMSVDVSPLVLNRLLPMLSKVLPLPRVLPSKLPLSLARMRCVSCLILLSAESITIVYILP